MTHLGIDHESRTAEPQIDVFNENPPRTSHVFRPEW